ncbi:MAG: UDP-glucose/GDP-mannose dehydrogenase family protein [Elusimicrobiales bacterium]|nr:UDP-glucose/GDP-mannose dehydrogenase family protein [Elusimicrobiales bacterium]
MRTVNICVVGTGYVGLVTGACLAEAGHRVVCVDSDKKKISLLKKGKIPIYEPGLEEVVKRNARAGRLLFTGSVEEGVKHGGHRAEAVFIAVGTPPRSDGSADLSFVEHVASQVARAMEGYTAIIEKSTVPVETGEWVHKTVTRLAKPGIAFDVVSNPEFLREGSAVDDFLRPDRVVVGTSSARAAELMRAIYAPLKCPVLVTDVKSAELIKHASNSFLAAKISFINAVANVCERTGANVEDVAKGMGMDKRIGASFLKAGIGFGGFCFPKDLEAFYWISKQKGYDFSMLRAVKEVNEEQKLWLVRRAEEELWNLGGKTVALLGLAFKPETDDMRFAPSIDIIAALKERGAKVKVYDPVAMPNAKEIIPGVQFCKSALECVRDADCLALVTEWAEFKNLDMKKVHSLMRHPLLLDGRNLYDAQAMRRLGFAYKSVGRK